MIDEATIRRVADESGAEAWWVSGNEDSVEFYAVLHQFARAIEQLARQEQREEILNGYEFFKREGKWLAEAIRTAALPVAGEKGDGK